MFHVDYVDRYTVNCLYNQPIFLDLDVMQHCNPYESWNIFFSYLTQYTSLFFTDRAPQS